MAGPRAPEGAAPERPRAGAGGGGTLRPARRRACPSPAPRPRPPQAGSAGWAGRLRVHELVGDLLTHRRHEIGVLLKEVQVLVVGAGDDRVDLDGVGAPVLEEQGQYFARQGAGGEALHELALAHSFLPALRRL